MVRKRLKKKPETGSKSIFRSNLFLVFANDNPGKNGIGLKGYTVEYKYPLNQATTNLIRRIFFESLHLCQQRYSIVSKSALNETKSVRTK